MEEKRRKMMLAAVPKLKYYETVRQSTEEMWNDSDAFGDVNTEAMDSAHNELMEFLNTKIQELKMDAEGKKRFIYTVKMEEDNGDEFFHNQVDLKTSEEVSKFISKRTTNEDAKIEYGYEEKPYTVPTAAEIDALLESKKSGGFTNIFSCGQEDINALYFTVLRQQVNY
jgi:hemerythrin